MGISNQINFYKAYEGKGSALELSFKRTDRGPAIFLSMAKEIGEKTFDWKNKVNFKVGLTDGAAILTVMDGQKGGLGKQKDDGKFGGLYHENDKGNSVFGMEKRTKGDGFFLSLSVTADGNRNGVTISISPEETRIMKMFLETYMPNLFEVEYESRSEGGGSSQQTKPAQSAPSNPVKKASAPKKVAIPAASLESSQDEIPF